MNAQFLNTILTALLSSTGGWGILQFILARRQKRAQDEKDADATTRENRRVKQVEDSQNWYRQSRHHYDLAKREAAESRSECNECRKELEHTRHVIYRLLEELEDQIIPMITTPSADLAATRIAARAAIKQARESLATPS